MKHELQDCPFCGEPAEMDSQRAFRALDTGKLGKAVAIYCQKCPADVTLCYGDFSALVPDDVIALAVDSWNTRDGVKPAQQKAEAVNRALQDGEQ